MSDFQSDLNILPQNTGDNEGTKVSFYIETYGCQMNSYDSQAIAGLLANHGHFQRVNEYAAAQIVLLNTCSVRDHAEHKVISRIGQIRQERKRNGDSQPIIGICGCMAERLGTALARGNHRVDLVVGVDRYPQLPGLLNSLVQQADSQAPAVAVGHIVESQLVAPPELYPTNNSHLVTIHKGCDYKCTYCIVPATRGPQREKPLDVILDEIKVIVAMGGVEVTLLGQNVTAYKWGDLDFAGLLEHVARIEGLARIRFLTGHPCDMHPHLMETVGRLEKVCPWLHIPIQSGSDKVLRRMKRYYTSKDYLDMVTYARQVIPDVTFSADFIVGFPGETEEDFCATLDIVRAVKYEQVFSFKYSERPGVPAAKLTDDVSVQEKKDRLARLMAVQAEVWTAMADQRLGECWEGVVEGKARKPEGAWLIRTGNNRKVVVEAPELELGKTVKVIVTSHRNSTFLGTLTD